MSSLTTLQIKYLLLTLFYITRLIQTPMDTFYSPLVSVLTGFEYILIEMNNFGRIPKERN